MANFNEYNAVNVPPGWQKYETELSWVLVPTNNHDEGIAIFWNEQTNEMAVFSQKFPHRGWIEYGNRAVADHAPWVTPNDNEWLFIGEL